MAKTTKKMLKKDLGSTSQTNEKVRSCASQLAPKNKIPTTTYFTESFKSMDIFSSLFTFIFESLLQHIPSPLFCLTNKPKKKETKLFLS